MFNAASSSTEHDARHEGRGAYNLKAAIHETLKWLSSLPTLMQKSFWWGQCSNRYIISLSPHLHSPFPPFSPSLINLVVSVDVKHGVYLLYFSRGLWKYRMSSSSCCLLDRPTKTRDDRQSRLSADEDALGPSSPSTSTTTQFTIYKYYDPVHHLQVLRPSSPSTSTTHIAYSRLWAGLA